MYLKKFSALTYTLFIMFVVSAASFNLFAELQKPEKFEAMAEGYLMDSVLHANLYMQWMNPDSVDGYNVYIAYTKTDNYNDFELLKTMNYPSDSLYRDSSNFWYGYIGGLDTKNSEIFSVYISAFKNGQISEPSNISTCYITGKREWHTFEFTTTPLLTAKINEEYVYEFDTQTDIEDATFEYELYCQQGNAILDKENKKITFTPTESGIYYFSLSARAYNAQGDYAETYQYWEVRVIECEKPSTISGTVKNENGDFIKWGYASLYMVTKGKSDSTEWYNYAFVQQIAFEDGQYTFTGLDKGTYYMQMYGIDSNQKAGYYAEWFDNAQNFENSTPIELTCDDSKTADFILEKIPEPNYYKVSGFVKDAATTQPIVYASVEFLGEDTHTGQYVSYYAMTDVEGYYEITLPDGIIYTAVAYAGYYYYDSLSTGQIYYYPMYWDAKTDPALADKIELKGDLNNINFNLEKVPVPNYYIVSGFVKDAGNNQPIEWAEVDFMGEDPIYGQYVSYSAFTNSEGYYEASLPEGINYTAVASVGCYILKDSTYFPGQSMYLPLYWDNKTDPAEADKIEVKDNVSNINFNLRKLEIYENTVNGYAKNEQGEPLQNILMIAYIIDGTEDVDNMYRGYLAMTDNNGYFEMKNLYPAEYVLLAVPAMNILYAPGFYKENDFATLTWEDATKITVGNTGTFGAYNVKLQLFEKVIGIGIVKGIVRAETGRVKSSNELQGKDGLQGVQVHMVDLLGNRIKSTETDKTGSYQFTGLSKGTYKVVIDKIGYKSDQFNVTIDEDNTLVDKSVTLAPSGTTKVEDNTFLTNGISLYPNPTTDLFTVKFKGNGNIAKIKLFDAQGNVVYTNDISTNLGENNYNISAANLSSGTYFVKIEMNKSSLITPVIITK